MIKTSHYREDGAGFFCTPKGNDQVLKLIKITNKKFLKREEMRKWAINLFCLSLLLFLSSCATGLLSENDLVTEEFMLPGTFQGPSGTYTANLDTLVIRPNDGQPHPMAVINHGVDGHDLKSISVEKMRGMAIEFARRGWVAVAFTRRGFGKSEGQYVEGPSEPMVAGYQRGGRIASKDIREVMRLMSEKSYVNSSRIICIGVSGGGFATLALTAYPPPGLVAAINFAGGLSAHVKGTDSVFAIRNESAEVEAFGRYGKTSRIPTLWVYAANDRLFDHTFAMRLYTAFTDAGGKAEFVTGLAWGDNGHWMFFNSTVWAWYVDDFLKKREQHEWKD